MLIRTLTGILFIVVLSAAVLISPYTSAILFLIFVILGINEFYTIARKNNISIQKYLGNILGITFFLLSTGVWMGGIDQNLLFLLIPLVFLIFIAELFRKKKNPFTNIAFTLLGVIYVAMPFTLLFGIGFFSNYGFDTEYNSDLLISVLILMWSNDTGAYLVGKSMGKHKLFERISPRKTWEGSIGGGIVTLIMAYVVNRYILEIDFLDCIFLSLFIVFFGTLGDLTESMFKRSANVKDSSDLLPGHGGILDRFDSLLLAAPFIYFYLRMIGSI